MLTNIKGAIFDMDGTLIDSLMLWEIIWEKIGDEFLNQKEFRPTPEDDKAVRTLTLKDAMYHIHNIYNIAQNGDELFDKVTMIIKNFYENDVKLKDGVSDLLEYCYTKGIKMCIASATDKNLIKIALEHCKIEKYFSNILSCADIGKGKEEPDIYLKALECLSTTIEETCIFEDSHIAIKTAHNIGIKTVGIYDKYNYGHDEMKSIATMYVDNGETLKKLINNGVI